MSAAPPTTGSGFSAPEDGDQLQLLARVTTELGAATAMSEIVEAAVHHAAGALGAEVSTLMLREGDRLRLIGSHGLGTEAVKRFADFGVDDDTPAGEAARTGRPVVHGADVGARYAGLEGYAPPERSVVCLPLATGARVGVLGLSFAEGWLPGPHELDFLTTFAEACGQAVRRVRAAEEAGERQRQLEFLADASAELAASLDYQTTLTNVARLAVPALADWCSVEILEGDHIRTVALAHADPAKVEWAWTLRRRYPPALDSSGGIGSAIRLGRSQLVPLVDAELLTTLAQDAEHLRLVRGLGLRSAMVVPLVAPGGRVVGAMNLSRAEDPRPYTDADLALAEDLCRRAGLAIENAFLHSQTRDTAEQLQRAVLPSALDDLPGWEVATHYEPGGRSGVGGDFYGATVLPDDRLAVFIGDVMGHGVGAASAMAQLRSAVRAFLTMDPDPTLVLHRLRALVRERSVTQLATLAYGVIDRSAGTLELVTAGHLAPLIVRVDGSVSAVPVPPVPVLGGPEILARSTTVPFDDGDVLIMFTDGLVERRAELLDDGIDRLADAAAELAGPDLATALRGVVPRVRAAEADDDIAVIAVRGNA